MWYSKLVLTQPNRITEQINLQSGYPDDESRSESGLLAMTLSINMHLNANSISGMTNSFSQICSDWGGESTAKQALASHRGAGW